MAQVICNAEAGRLLALRPEDRVRSCFQAHSAGISAQPGRPMAAQAIRALEELGFHPHKHEARVLTGDLADGSDAIYCMTDKQCRTIAERHASATWKVQRLDPLKNIELLPDASSDHVVRVATRIRQIVCWRLESQLRFPLSAA